MRCRAAAGFRSWRWPACAARGEAGVLSAGATRGGAGGAGAGARPARLAAGGARLGVLMGTAYLFTEEAVSSGAIQPGFQRAAIECASTVLLETAPGHAT